MLRTILILGRVSNLPTVWTNVLAGWFLAGGGWDRELLWIEIGVSLLYVAGMTLNDAFDEKWDRQHAPERPIPSGAIPGGAVWSLGVLQLCAGVAVLLLATDMVWIWIAALVGAILLYDWIHKKTPLAVLIMGACRGLVYIGAASALLPMDQFSVILWVLVAATVVYVAGITVLARSERGGDRSPRWLNWLGRAMEYAPLFLLAVAPDQMDTGWLRTTLWVVLLVFLLGWVTISMRLLKADMGLGIPLLIAGICIIDGAAIIYGDMLAGAVCLVMLPVTLLFQRFIPAT